MAVTSAQLFQQFLTTNAQEYHAELKQRVGQSSLLELHQLLNVLVIKSLTFTLPTNYWGAAVETLRFAPHTLPAWLAERSPASITAIQETLTRVLMSLTVVT